MRTLKPSFFKNEDLALVDPLGRVLYAALWCLADREGRLEDRPVRIKAEALPYDECDPEGLLDQLAEHGFIVRYEVDGRRCIWIPTFRQHQRPHPREARSAIPPAPGDTERDQQPAAAAPAAPLFEAAPANGSTRHREPPASEPEPRPRPRAKVTAFVETDPGGFLDWWCAAYKRERKHGYSVQPKDRSCVSRMLSATPLPELQACALRFLRLTPAQDPYLAGKGRTLALFEAKLNDPAVRCEEVAPVVTDADVEMAWADARKRAGSGDPQAFAGREDLREAFSLATDGVYRSMATKDLPAARKRFDALYRAMVARNQSQEE